MAKETNAAPAAPKVKKTRTPRTLSGLEIEAKAQFDDAKALTKILSAIEKLGPWGFSKLSSAVSNIASQVK